MSKSIHALTMETENDEDKTMLSSWGTKRSSVQDGGTVCSNERAVVRDDLRTVGPKFVRQIRDVAGAAALALVMASAGLRLRRAGRFGSVEAATSCALARALSWFRNHTNVVAFAALVPCVSATAVRDRAMDALLCALIKTPPVSSAVISGLDRSTDTAQHK